MKVSLNPELETPENPPGLDPEEHLLSIPQEGFTTEQHHQLTSRILAVGLPVDNYTKLSRRANEPETRNNLASWGVGSENYGEFTEYELLDEQIPERQLAALVHEGAHANTPRRKENAPLYGGESKRAQAELFARDLAAQTLMTGKYLTGYHKHLAAELINGQKTPEDYELFVEETQAIAMELAITNRAKLEQVESAQQAKLANLQRAGLVDEDIQPVNLLSHAENDDEVQVEGIDNELIALLDGVSDHKELMAHVANLKERFYPDKSLAIVKNRAELYLDASQKRLRKISEFVLLNLSSEDQLAASA
jgi:hypothetical protein